MALPAKAGFYWAKWVSAERDTRHASALTPSDEWEVVSVFENSTDQQADEFLRVLVTGVEKIQAIANFEWGPGPLLPPEGLR